MLAYVIRCVRTYTIRWVDALVEPVDVLVEPVDVLVDPFTILLTAHEHDLLTPLSQMFLFSKRSAAVIDGSEKRNDWLNLELQNSYVIERLSNISR